MRVHRSSMIAVSIAVLVVHPAAAQSKRGTWSGTSTTQQGTQQFTIVLDSSASGANPLQPFGVGDVSQLTVERAERQVTRTAGNLEDEAIRESQARQIPENER